MIALLYFALAVLTAPFKLKSRLEAENGALRHQLIVLRRKMQGRGQLANSDRWFFIQLYRWAEQEPVDRQWRRLNVSETSPSALSIEAQMIP